jgi:hypothetical protein
MKLDAIVRGEWNEQVRDDRVRFTDSAVGTNVGNSDLLDGRQIHLSVVERDPVNVRQISHDDASIRATP